MKKQMKIIAMGSMSFSVLALGYVYTASAKPSRFRGAFSNVYRCEMSGIAGRELVLTVSNQKAALSSSDLGTTIKPRIHRGLHNDWAPVYPGRARFGSFRLKGKIFDLQVEKALLAGEARGNVAVSGADGTDDSYYCTLLN